MKITNGGAGTIAWNAGGTSISPHYVGGAAPAYSSSGTDIIGLLIEGGSTPSVTIVIIGLNII
jgi:hypothetical protein